MSYVGNKPAQTTIPADDAVTTAMLKDDAVTSAKIDDLTIVNTDINASAAIDTTKIADGTVTSAEFQYINTLASNAQTQITARLPLAGGTMSGTIAADDQQITKPRLTDYSETVNAIGTITSGTNADLEDGNVQSVTMTANTFNFGITNALTSHSNSLTLIITNGGLATITWLSGAHGGGGNAVQRAGGTAPTLTSSGTDIVAFTTFNGGTNWYGFAAGIAMAAP